MTKKQGGLKQRLGGGLLAVLVGTVLLGRTEQAPAQLGEQVIKSFGLPGAAYPAAELIQGRDGALYGTTVSGGANGNGTVFTLATNGGGYAVLHAFTGTDGDGASPTAGLVQGTDGALYGTTYGGGTNGCGTVFRLATNGGGFSILYTFTGTDGDGANPYAGLVQGTDGALYGTTYGGGTNFCGTVFTLATNGGGYAVLYSFTNSPGDGAYPFAGLVQGADGALYGTTSQGGTNGFGTVFTLATNGGGYAVLYSFTGTDGDGAYPYAGLVQGVDGALYGTTQYGGTNGYGSIFTLATNGSSYALLYSFTNNTGDGAAPFARLVQGADGALYGTTQYGGTNGYGTVFTLATNGGGYAVLHSFTNSPGDGAYPAAGLVQGADGALYGTTYQGGTIGYGTVFTLATNGSGYTLLYSFIGDGKDGISPAGGLVQGADGALYGTTQYGGTSFYGTVFMLTTNGGSYAMLHSFTNNTGDGANPQAGLVQGADGALYGTTYSGGANNWGTIFKLATDGSGYTVLHSFINSPEDGANPQAGLVQGADGALYGTTSQGGTSGAGTVFTLTTNGGDYAVLHSFTNRPGDGAYPYAGLVQGADGLLYGTTLLGGTNGGGTVFRLTTNGGSYAVLYNFGSTSEDGANPYAGLVQGTDGVLYGTTYGGGTNYYGTVFKLATDGGGYAVLHTFTNSPGDGSPGDGANPQAGLVQGADGALYGTATYGGTIGAGILFRLATDGSGYAVLHSFTNSPGDGILPYAGLVQGADGALYGATVGGGVLSRGTVFRFGLPQDVTAGLVGHWPFEEGSGTTAADTSGGGHTAYLSNGVAWVSGQIDSAIQADGINDSVYIPPIDLSGTLAVSVSMWVKRTYSVGSTSVLLENSPNYNNSVSGFALCPEDDICNGALKVGLRGNSGYSVNCQGPPASGTWHHLVFIFDKSQGAGSELSVYLDGGLQSALNQYLVSDNTNPFGNNPIYLFARAGTSLFCAGSMDDLRLYDRALTAAEVQTLFGLGTRTVPPSPSLTLLTPTNGAVVGGACPISARATANTTVVGVQFQVDGANLGPELTAPPYQVAWGTASVTNGPHTVTARARDGAGHTTTATASVRVQNQVPLQGLVGYWPFDEGTGAVAADVSGNGHSATLYPGMHWVNGRLGGALLADGSNGYVRIPPINLSRTRAVSLSLWVNHVFSSSGGHTLLENSANFDQSNSGFGLFPDDNLCGSILLGVHGNAGYNLSCYPQPASGLWHHLVLIFDKSQVATNELRFYIDGVRQSPLRRYLAASNTNPFGNNPTYLFSQGGAAEFTAGMMDELRLYNRVLSEIEVQQLYAAGTVVPNTVTAAAPVITRLQRLSPDQFQLQFTGSTGVNYSILGSSSPADWTVLGLATETSPGQFQFTDPNATNQQRFYRIRSP